MHSLLRGPLTLALAFALAFACASPSLARAQTLRVDGTTITLGGVHRYDAVEVVRGGRIVVPPFDGTDRAGTGNLVLVAGRILVDSTSSIDARGAGYQPLTCGDGRGPAAVPLSGGRGGCSVRDSGGGGGHFGRGGRGTKDCFIFGPATSCQFPQEFEESCGSLAASGASCVAGAAGCYDLDGLPTVAGDAYRHSIYDAEFGAAGGDKGCGDGFDALSTGGAGGGRVVLVALTDAATGALQIDGRVTAAGRRGCGSGNDSGGGGAGGSVLLVGDQVQVGAGALVTAAGGLGGDTRSGAAGQPDAADCAGRQAGGTCDDCGGGGGGGIINVLSRTASLDPRAAFDVGGAEGGVCDICRGEAGGGAGELLLDGAYVGELCDGFDNDFDGAIDEGLGSVSCGLGTCARDIAACAAGAPVTCAPSVGADPSCRAADAGARPRIAVVLDTSSSMLLDLRGYPTFGDGSADRPGLDTDGNGQPDDARLFLAREALANVISAYPEIDFALARYHQDQGLRRSCQTAKWFECEGLIGTYDNPTDNTGTTVCSVPTGPATSVSVREVSTAGDECINYAGTCGAPRRGADILSGFGSPTRDLVRWLDGRETAFDPDATSGDVCRHTRAGRDCEVRASGETPLGGALQSAEDYMVPIRATDPSAGCRGYSIILVTDGAESCGGDPEAQARRLHDTFGIETVVIAVSVLPGEEAQLNRIAQAGSGGARTSATFVRNPGDLVPALTSILEGSIRTERCNATDDDCDGRIDEGFRLAVACDDGGRGACRGEGATVCADDGLSTVCDLTMPGERPGSETCNALDDDCDEGIDEGLDCTVVCAPTGPEICNGRDDDCNGLTDEADPALGTACGASEGVCEAGALRCVAGALRCIGAVGPRDEVCNGLDDDCDGEGDDLAPCPGSSLCLEGACRRGCDPAAEFPCPVGFACVVPPGASGFYCTPTACATCAPGERCIDDRCVDPCAGVTCADGEVCRNGDCLDCHATGCPSGALCAAGRCTPDRCEPTTCAPAEACFDGDCQPPCGPSDCPSGQRCAPGGACEADPCAGVSCEAGRVCNEGTCAADPCPGLRCPVGDVCAPGAGCIDDPCVTVACPAGRRCVVAPDGLALCARQGPPDVDAGSGPWVLAAGGAAQCSAARGARGDGLPWLAVLGVMLLARRGSRRIRASSSARASLGRGEAR